MKSNETETMYESMPILERMQVSLEDEAMPNRAYKREIGKRAIYHRKDTIGREVRVGDLITFISPSFGKLYHAYITLNRYRPSDDVPLKLNWWAGNYRLDKIENFTLIKN